jgi:hypothetical protein
VSTPQQAIFFSSIILSLFLFYTYLLIVSLQIANKYGIQKKKIIIFSPDSHASAVRWSVVC